MKYKLITLLDKHCPGGDYRRVFHGKKQIQHDRLTLKR